MDNNTNLFNDILYAKYMSQKLADRNPETVSEQKIWKKIGRVYKCGNCGFTPTYIDISDWKICPKCELIKLFYETDHDLKPIFSYKKGYE